jgi:tetratricopeptide (TPR) repeat protein
MTRRIKKNLLLVSLAAAVFFSGCQVFPKMTVISDPLARTEHLQLGQAYESQGRPDLAEKEYLLAQPDPKAYLALGNLYFAKSNEDPKYRSQAAQYYRRALNAAPSPEAANNLAWLYMLDDRLYNTAENLARRAIREGKKQGLDEASLQNFQDTLLRIQRARALKEKADP